MVYASGPGHMHSSSSSMLFALPLSENELWLGSLPSFQWSELGLETSLVVLIIKDEHDLFFYLCYQALPSRIALSYKCSVTFVERHIVDSNCNGLVLANIEYKAFIEI